MVRKQRWTLLRSFTVLILVGLLAGALAACAPVASPEGGEVAAPATERETIDIRFWNHWLAARVELIDKMIADFQEANPDITVENLGQPWERREENLFTALASDDPPEVLMATRSEILKLADDGLIVPITDIVEADRAGPRGLLSRRDRQLLLGRRTLLDAHAHRRRRHQPDTGQLRHVRGRRAGSRSRPRPGPSLEEMAKALTVDRRQGHRKIGANCRHRRSRTFFAWLYCNNGQIYSDDLQSGGLQLAGRRPDAGVDGQLHQRYQRRRAERDRLLRTGQARPTEAQPWYNDAQLINFPNVSIFFHMQTYQAGNAVGHGACGPTTPTMRTRSRTGSPAKHSPGATWCPKACRRSTHEAAFKWIKKITYDEDSAGWFVMQQGRPSPIRAVNEDPIVLRCQPALGQGAPVAGERRVRAILPGTRPGARHRRPGSAGGPLRRMTPEEALNDAAEQAQAMVDEYWSSKE